MEDMHFDKEGNPIDLKTWSKLFNDLEYKVLVRTMISSATDLSKTYDVSTIWLGLNHQWGDGPPLIFETMVFGDGSMDLDMQRYSTWQEALEGHTQTVTVVAATMDDPIIMDTRDIVKDA